MKGERLVVFLLATLLLVGCGTKKKVVFSDTMEPEVTEPEVPAWHTCLIQGARATVITEEDKISATVTMQTVRDSMIIISVMPMLGIEMARLEATPLEIIAIDKIHGRYAVGTFAELNRKLTPDLNWDILQQLCTAELPTGSEKARLIYSFGSQTLEVVMNYPPRQLDVPVRVTNQRLNRYTEIDVSKFF